ncbi:immunity 53 family protein [Nonomuraea indica]|uniref:immunity 53 family protein n=1 Tax=Nonomuraea indica TaxID=1581193 RepID=UPI000C7CE798|nr:immunity 53 family protein [Nonomuraea indica]
MITDALGFLQSWYTSHCDGDWEHSYGVTIDTLDNPGWRLKIDLLSTPLAGALLDRLVVERTEDDWVHVWSDGTHFEGACGPLNLGEVLEHFRVFAGPASARGGEHV